MIFTEKDAFCQKRASFFRIQPEPAYRHNLIPLQYFQNNLRIICIISERLLYLWCQTTRVLTLKFKPMTKEEREDLLQKKENLKLLFEFHTENRVIKDDPEFEQYINDILDMIAEIEEKLKE